MFSQTGERYFDSVNFRGSIIAQLAYNGRSLIGSGIEVMDSGASQVSCLLREMKIGIHDAEDRLLGAVYSELRKIAAIHLKRDRPGHTLQPSALVNETYLRLMDSGLPDVTGKNHFLSIASKVMRRVLVDYARARSAQKRGGKQVREEEMEIVVAFHGRVEDLLALDQALGRLETWDERQSKIVELRFFGGMTEEEIAEMLNISVRTVKREWAMARAWLHGQLDS